MERIVDKMAEDRNNEIINSTTQAKPTLTKTQSAAVVPFKRKGTFKALNQVVSDAISKNLCSN